MTLVVSGSKGGASSTPTQANDTLSSTAYAQILDLISEGPIYGPVDSVSPARSVYFNDTVVQNADGTYNFNVSQLDLRLGALDQTYINGFDTTSNDVPIGVQLKNAAPWVHTITNLDLNAVRITLSLNSLSQTSTANGDVTGYRVAYQVQLSVDGGSYSTVIDTAFSGKASSVYTRSHRVELAGAKSQYTLRVIRITPDNTSSYIQDTTNVVGYSELIDAKLRYPFSAVCGIALDASQFSSEPTRSYDLKGLLVKYPSNYNPNTRTYSGTWDGTFVTGWTDNPAWVFYDLALTNRYGAGKWIDAMAIDRYALYTIAQYCDVMVSDGKGGQEPRFTCNCYIQDRAGAFKVLQDLASVFRGMAYWAAGSAAVTADMPLDPAYIYTPANVIGAFKYVGSSLKTRYTVALVTWNDPENAYKQAIEYVEDADGVARYGINKAQVAAFACTSRGQAQRVGHWTLITSRAETNTVTFSVGLDGTLAQPGQIIAIADPARAGIRLGGRVRSASSTTTLTLDSPPPGITAGDTLTVITPTGKTEARTVSLVSGPIITVSPGYSAVPTPQAVWMREAANLKAQLFRVAKVDDKGGIQFEITATQHEPSKYAAIDSGAAIDLRPISGMQLTTQQPPTNVAASQFVVIDQGIARTHMTLSWSAAPNATSYMVQWRKDSGEWITAGSTGGLSIDVAGIYAGSYVVRVKAVNAMDINSPYAYSPATVLAGKTGTPPSVVTLTASTDQVFAINLGWSFPPNSGDTAYTEVFYSRVNNLSTATQLSTYSYPTNTAQLLGLAAGVGLYFWARLVDTTGNIGPWFPASTVAGVQGMSSADATAILTYLTGQITQTQLGKDVLAPIQAIPGLAQQIKDTSAAVTQETQSRITADAALATRIDRVAAQYGSPPMAGDPTSFAGSVTTYAGVWSEMSARAEADLALSQKTDTITAQLQTVGNSLTAAVQTNANAYTNLNGRVAASYTIKTQVTASGHTYVAGIGVGVDNSSGMVESQVLVSASRFSVLDPNGGAVSSPFTIQGGQVLISQGLIGTGWIQNAMIGDVIQSNTVGANGQPRWRFDKNGTLTLNGTNSGAGYMTLNDAALCVYDGAGTLRVRLGLWS